MTIDEKKKECYMDFGNEILTCKNYKDKEAFKTFLLRVQIRINHLIKIANQRAVDLELALKNLNKKDAN